MTFLEIGVTLLAMGSTGECPPDPEDAAEAYLMNRLAPDESSAFQQHIKTCPSCNQIVEQTRDFIQGIRDAARDLTDEGDKPA